MTNNEKIAEGICVSERGVDHCPVCVDCCEASWFKHNMNEALKDARINKPKDNEDESPNNR